MASERTGGMELKKRWTRPARRNDALGRSGLVLRVSRTSYRGDLALEDLRVCCGKLAREVATQEGCGGPFDSLVTLGKGRDSSSPVSVVPGRDEEDHRVGKVLAPDDSEKGTGVLGCRVPDDDDLH